MSKRIEIIVRLLPKWLRTSNRWKHTVGVFLVSLIGTVLMGIGCIGGMEFKDVHHANGDRRPIREWEWSSWDWLDVAAGLIGSVAGGGINAVLVWLVFLKR